MRKQDAGLRCFYLYMHRGRQNGLCPDWNAGHRTDPGNACHRDASNARKPNGYRRSGGPLRTAHGDKSRGCAPKANSLLDGRHLRAHTRRSQLPTATPRIPCASARASQHGGSHMKPDGQRYVAISASYEAHTVFFFQFLQLGANPRRMSQ